MSKEFKIGLLALIASFMLYAGFNFLKGMDFFSNTSYYYVVYDNVSGLTISNPVMLNGLNVGRVKDIRIMQNEAHKLLVVIDVRSDLALGKASQAVLADNGLLGGKMIDLKIPPILQKINSGDTLVPVSNPSFMAMLEDKADPIIEQIEPLLSNLRDISEKFKTLDTESLNAALSDFKGITGTLNAQLAGGQLNSILTNLNSSSQDLAQAGKSLPQLTQKANTLMDSLNQVELTTVVNQANESMRQLNEILQGIAQGEGTLGALATNDSLYNSLNQVSEDVDKLVIDLRENPKRYVNISVFGRKEKEEKKK